MQHNEKRAYMRIRIDDDMTYRLADSTEFNPAHCVSLSGSGVSFIASQTITEGQAVEISIVPQNSITPAFSAFVEVVRIESLSDGNYEIAATIKTIKG